MARHGQIIHFGGKAPKDPWPNSELTTIIENEAYGLWVRRTWIGNQWHIEIIRKLQGATELNRVELFLSGEEIKLLKDSLT